MSTYRRSGDHGGKERGLYMPMYGISGAKQAELKSLTNQVEAAEYEVQELQSIVNALVEKSNTFQGFLADAEAKKDTALANLNLLGDAASAVGQLVKNSNVVFQRAKKANNDNKKVAGEMASIIEKVVFSADVVNRLTIAVNKKKELNPLIPDGLVSRMATATNSANKAVAAMLTALQSCYTAKATANESWETLTLENEYAAALLANLSGQPDTNSGASEISKDWKNLESVDKEFKAKLDEYLTASNQYEDKHREYESIVSEITEIEKNLHLLANRLYEEEEKEFESLVEKYEHDIIRRRDDAKEAEKDLKEAEKDVDEHKIREALEELRRAQHKYDEAERASSDAKQKLAEYQAINSEVRDMIDGLNKTFVALREVERESRKQVKESKSRMETTHAAFKKSKGQFNQAFQQLNSTLDFFERDEGRYTRSLEYLLGSAYKAAVQRYRTELDANRRVTAELESANKKLANAQNSLSSLQAGLSAATAAALAA